MTTQNSGQSNGPGNVPAPASSDLSAAAIDVQQLHTNFGKNEVLKGIDFHVPVGAVACVIGHSGAAKSTQLRCVNTLDTTPMGTAFVEGREIHHPDTPLT